MPMGPVAAPITTPVVSPVTTPGVTVSIPGVVTITTPITVPVVTPITTPVNPGKKPDYVKCDPNQPWLPCTPDPVFPAAALNPAPIQACVTQSVLTMMNSFSTYWPKCS